MAMPWLRVTVQWRRHPVVRRLTYHQQNVLLQVWETAKVLNLGGFIRATLLDPTYLAGEMGWVDEWAPEQVRLALEAIHANGLLIAENGGSQVKDWYQYQKDPTASERSRIAREKKSAQLSSESRSVTLSHVSSHSVTHDTPVSVTPSLSMSSYSSPDPESTVHAASHPAADVDRIQKAFLTCCRWLNVDPGVQGLTISPADERAILGAIQHLGSMDAVLLKLRIQAKLTKAGLKTWGLGDFRLVVLMRSGNLTRARDEDVPKGESTFYKVLA